VKGGFLLLILFTAFALAGELEQLKKRLIEGEFEEIILYLENKMLIEDLSTDELIVLAKAKLGTGRVDEANELIDMVLKKEPNNTQALTLRARILLESGKVEESLKILKNIPESSGKNYLLGVIYLNRGNLWLARSYFKRIPEGAVEKVLSKKVMGSFPIISSSLIVRYGYDSNPTVAPDFIAGEPSRAYKPSASLSYNGESVWLNASATFTKYEEVKNFDTLSTSLSFNYTLGKAFIPFYIDYISLGGDFYRTLSTIGIGYFLGEARIKLAGGYQNYYRTDIPQENRDGVRISAEISYLLSTPSWFLTPSISINYENTQGQNWRNYSIYPFIKSGIEAGRLTFGFSAGTAIYSFTGENTLFATKREDTFLTIRSFVIFRIWRWIRGEISLRYTNNNSNIDIYSYDRAEIYGGVGGAF